VLRPGELPARAQEGDLISIHMPRGRVTWPATPGRCTTPACPVRYRDGPDRPCREHLADDQQAISLAAAELGIDLDSSATKPKLREHHAADAAPSHDGDQPARTASATR
jgi:hypothetical protein